LKVYRPEKVRKHNGRQVKILKKLRILLDTDLPGEMLASPISRGEHGFGSTTKAKPALSAAEREEPRSML